MSGSSRLNSSSPATAPCWSTRSRRGFTTRATGRSMPAPRKPVRAGGARGLRVAIGGSGASRRCGDDQHPGRRNRRLASAPRRARRMPPPLRQGGGAARAQDGPRHPAVSAPILGWSASVFPGTANDADARPSIRGGACPERSRGAATQGEGWVWGGQKSPSSRTGPPRLRSGQAARRIEGRHAAAVPHQVGRALEGGSAPAGEPGRRADAPREAV